MRNFWSKLKPTKQTPSTNLLQLYQQSPNLKPHPNQLETIKLLQQINTALSTSSRPSKAGIYLWGGVGTGKTMLMDLFYHSLTNVTKKRIHFHPFMRDIHRRIHLLKQQRTHLGDPIIPIVDQLVDEAKVFCFDELQVTDISDAMILRRLFTELFTRDTIIITTSNRHPDDLYKNGIQRDSFLPTIELLKERLIVHCLDTKDYRREKKDMFQVYFHPIDSYNINKINKIWELLTRNQTVEQRTLNFLGRQLIFTHTTSSGLIKATFNDLCGKALGTIDYLELVKNFHTCVLTDLPRVELDGRDLIKRFILMIDTFYENKVKLIILSDVNVNDLFPGPNEDVASVEEIFAFQRCLSRLVEMQSREWIGKDLEDVLQKII